MSSVPICPCGAIVHPAALFNTPGLAAIRYRAGDFSAFRHALLLPLDGEVALAEWRPGATDDLGVQLLEWWAVLADILTFYNERAANESFLRTAIWPDSVANLVRLLGYRPRPGIGASGYVAALLTGKKAVIVPQGFPIQSKPGPGQQPQVFETDAEVIATWPDVVDADPPPVATISSSVLLEGEISGIVLGERLLLVNRGWADGAADYYLWVTVSAVTPETDLRGKKNTRVSFTPSAAPPAALHADDFRLLRAGQTGGVWPYETTQVIRADQLHAASIMRAMQPGTLLLIVSPSSNDLVTISTYKEVVWYANAPDPATPDEGPSPTEETPIPIPHTRVAFTPSIDPNLDTSREQISLFFDWRDVGRIIATPATSVSGGSFTLTAVTPPTFPPVASGTLLLVEDGQDRGVLAQAASIGDAKTLTLTVDPAPQTPLQAPVRVLFNLLPVSRGKTIAAEVLGSGDATRAGQEFVLKKAPTTYLPATDAAAPETYRSTLQVFVNGIGWQEVPSFYGQSKDARVFVTKEDEAGKTHVLFGDGVQGARLPSGQNNVVAYYRQESGAAVPDPGKLSLLLQPLTGLKEVRSPVPPGGGSDPDPAARLQSLAPRSVLAFNRAVSADDYTVIASQAPGVTRARAYFSFDGVSQRTLPHVYVGDNAAAVASAHLALRRVMDPNMPLQVSLAQALPLRLVFTLGLETGYLPEPVVASVKSALLDANTGLFGVNNTRIGQSVFRSHIYQACHAIEGVSAVQGLLILFLPPGWPGGFLPFTGVRLNAGEGRFFQLTETNLVITVRELVHG
jgi:hypothetical protein